MRSNRKDSPLLRQKLLLADTMLTTVTTSICWPFKHLTSSDSLEKDLTLSAQGKEHNYAEQFQPESMSFTKQTTLAVSYICQQNTRVTDNIKN